MQSARIELHRLVEPFWRYQQPPVEMDLFANQLRVGCWEEQAALLGIKLRSAIEWVERITRRTITLTIMHEWWRHYPCDSDPISLHGLPIKDLAWLQALQSQEDPKPVYRDIILTAMGAQPTQPVVFRTLSGNSWSNEPVAVTLQQNDRTNRVAPVPETCWPSTVCWTSCNASEWNVQAIYVAGYSCQEELLTGDNSKLLDAVLIAGEALYHGGESKQAAAQRMLTQLAWKV